MIILYSVTILPFILPDSLIYLHKSTDPIVYQVWWENWAKVAAVICGALIGAAIGYISDKLANWFIDNQI